jgi:hypothetical protein
MGMVFAKDLACVLATNHEPHTEADRYGHS